REQPGAAAEDGSRPPDRAADGAVPVLRPGPLWDRRRPGGPRSLGRRARGVRPGVRPGAARRPGLGQPAGHAAGRPARGLRVMRRRDGGLSDPDVTLRLERVLGTAVRDCRGIGGQHGVRHCRVTLADGSTAFAKLADADSEAAGFAAEARGVRWLGRAGAGAGPGGPGVGGAGLAISGVPEEAPARQAAERFGGDLARLHAAGAAAFGAPWPGSIAGLPLPNDAGTFWPEWYATKRLLPYARRARDAGS